MSGDAAGTTSGSSAEKKGPLARFATQVSSLLSILVKALTLAIIVVVVVAFVLELNRNVVLVEPISAPDDLVQQGFSGTVLAKQFVDEVRRIRENADTSKQPLDQAILPDWAQADLEIPGTGVSFRAVVRYIQEAFGEAQPRITGEVTAGDGRIFLQMRGPVDQGLIVEGLELADLASVSRQTVKRLLELGAREFVRRTDPYILAAYLENSGEVESAVNEIKHCISSAPPSDDAWAFNLWGNIHLNAREPELAGEMYAQAIAIDPGLSYPYGNWSQALIVQGKYDEAVEKLEAGHAAVPRDTRLIVRLAERYRLRLDSSDLLQFFEDNAWVATEDLRFASEWGLALIEQAIGDEQNGRADAARSGFLEAASLLKRALGKAPGSIDLNRRYAISLDHLGRSEEAAVHNQRAVLLEEAK